MCIKIAFFFLLLLPGMCTTSLVCCLVPSQSTARLSTFITSSSMGSQTLTRKVVVAHSLRCIKECSLCSHLEFSKFLLSVYFDKFTNFTYTSALCSLYLKNITTPPLKSAIEFTALILVCVSVHFL